MSARGAKKPCRAVMGRAAIGELREAVEYLEQRSAGAGRQLLADIDRCICRPRRFPESAPVDPNGSSALFGPGAEARSTHEAGYSIRYVYPVVMGAGEPVILLVSIRHGRRLPVDDPEYMRRFLTEILRGRAGRT